MEPIDLPFSSGELFATEHGRQALETLVFPKYIPGCRWFGGKARQPQRFPIEELAAIGEGPEAGRLVVVRVGYAASPDESYLLPLQVTRNAAAEAPIARLADGAVLVDALRDAAFRAELLSFIDSGKRLPFGSGELRGERGGGFPAEASPAMPSRLLSVEQSNSSVIYGSSVFLKLYRKLEDGENPDVEITRFLSERQHFTHVPGFCGTVEFLCPGREPQVLALALGLVENQGDAWAFTLAEVSKCYDALIAGTALEMATEAFAARARQLGIRTGELHLALAADSDDPAFAPEPFNAADQQVLADKIAHSIEHMLALLKTTAGREQGHRRDILNELLACGPELQRRTANFAAHPVQAMKMRTHGDYHLGQVLNTGYDFLIIDFEGEPQRTLAARKEKRSPLRDVAGMLRSFHYGAYCDLMSCEDAGRRQAMERWAGPWTEHMSNAFLQGWRETVDGAPFVPSGEDEFTHLLNAFLIEKAIYEVCYELNNRPAWVAIPAKGILQIVG